MNGPSRVVGSPISSHGGLAMLVNFGELLAVPHTPVASSLGKFIFTKVVGGGYLVIQAQGEASGEQLPNGLHDGRQMLPPIDLRLDFITLELLSSESGSQGGD